MSEEINIIMATTKPRADTTAVNMGLKPTATGYESDSGTQWRLVLDPVQLIGLKIKRLIFSEADSRV